MDGLAVQGDESVNATREPVYPLFFASLVKIKSYVALLFTCIRIRRSSKHVIGFYMLFIAFFVDFPSSSAYTLKSLLNHLKHPR